MQQPPPPAGGPGGGLARSRHPIPIPHRQALDVVGRRVPYVNRLSSGTLSVVPRHVPHEQALFGHMFNRYRFACGARLVVQPAQRIKVHDVRVFHCDVDVHLLLHLADCAVQYLFRRA